MRPELQPKKHIILPGIRNFKNLMLNINKIKEIKKKKKYIILINKK